MQHMAFSSVLGTVSLKLLQRLSYKLQIRATVPNFRLCLKLPLKCCHIYFVMNSSAFAKHFCFLGIKDNPSKFIASYSFVFAPYCNLLDSLLLLWCSILSCVLCLYCCYLISGFLLWSNSFISVKLDIPRWFAMTACSGSPSLHLRSHADSLKIFF